MFIAVMTTKLNNFGLIVGTSLTFLGILVWITLILKNKLKETREEIKKLNL